MKLKSKSWVLLLICGLLLCLGLWSLLSNSSLAADSEVLHVLNRLSFGPAPGDFEFIKSKGIEAYIQAQLSPESIPESSQLTNELNQFKSLQMTPVELYQEYGRPRKKKGQRASPEELQRIIKSRQKPRQEAQQAHLLRAIASSRQLQEVMVDFWFNHFNVNIRKSLNLFWTGNYEQEAIRPHVLGHFRDLLEATARHPAMLYYLDNWLNTAPDSPGVRGRFKGLNENYARELMELHTLGVDGGYTQEDVISLARILTGWGIDQQGRRGDRSGFYFDKNRHDWNDKILLGKTIKGSGITEVEQAFDILSSHPSTARHISYKLAQYFVADEPPQSLVDPLVQRFSETDGDIRAVLETLFNSPEFSDPAYYQKKFKTPYQYIVSLIRASGIENPRLRGIAGMISQLGMQIYACETPNGYKNTQEAWLNPDGMLRRVSFAAAIANGRFSQEKAIDGDKLTQTLGNNFSENTKAVLESSSPKLRASLILGSPEMMYR